MTSKALTLIALLAPLPAAAFGNLDCITLETCVGDDCQPAQTADPFSITFDWPNETALIEVTSTDAIILPWAATSDDAASAGTVLDYANADGSGSALRLVANGADITAYYSLARPRAETWVGTCDVRRAA